ncbi:MAG TPA: hypothetical protein V6C81_25805 [Planktothrix sp.]|jgi:hypothetical protein
MADDVSKLCSDFLREWYPGLKTAHARELVAAYFGYKSHAALLSDKGNSLEFLEIAAVLIPTEGIVDERRECLNGLIETLPRSDKLTDELTTFLQAEAVFEGEVWDCADIGEFLIEEYLPQHLSPDLDFELAKEIASTNATFEDISYDWADVQESQYGITVTVSGTYSGYHHSDEEFAGDQIDFEVIVFLRFCAGRIAFEEPEIFVESAVNRDYLKEEAILST